MRIIKGVLVTMLMFVQLQSVEANVTTDEIKFQLTAITDYIQYQFGSLPMLQASKTADSILAGAAWIVAAQEDSGHFGYEYVPYEDRYLDDDGMVRQAGTLFALSEVYKHQTEKDPVIADTIERAIDYFISMSVEEDTEDLGFWCIKNNSRSSRCDLGSASLALIGILNYVTSEPERAAQYEEVIEKYFSYLMAAKFPDEGFSMRYTLGDGFSSKESPFYNGEAMLALVKYYQYEKDEEVKAALDEVFIHLSNQEEYETPLYLWIMAALKDMQRLWPSDSYVQYAKDFTEWRLDRSERIHGFTRNYCAPVEGFTSAYSVLDGVADEVLLSRLNREIEFWLGKTSYLQIDSQNPYRLVTIEDKMQLRKTPNPALADGGFLTGIDELTERIDFTQHCVSAYLQKHIDIDGKEL